jgi:hypothetical protein
MGPSFACLLTRRGILHRRLVTTGKIWATSTVEGSTTRLLPEEITTRHIGLWGMSSSTGGATVTVAAAVGKLSFQLYDHYYLVGVVARIFLGVLSKPEGHWQVWTLMYFNPQRLFFGHLE